jgi:DNA-binding LacI/PurR family transcriptional regulator
MQIKSLKLLISKMEHGDQKKIAKKVGVSINTVSNFFTGRRDVSQDKSTAIVMEATRLISERRKHKEELEKIIRNVKN